MQRCFRAVDIDVVGSTDRHLTYFQMMGNFSFGDYFKPGAVEMAYELSTGAFGLAPEHIWATVYEGDDQIGPDDVARDLWIAQGIPASRIVALGEDNFWKAGPTGPCGPCSELYYDRGARFGCGRAECRPGCDCDRFLEYWNLVFMEFDRGDDGRLTPLPAQNIDTGSGVERVAMLLQGAGSLFETDETSHVIQALERLSGRRYADGGDAVRSFRVLCDHARGMTAIATDGVTPSNEGRGYVLRRILRRAVLHGTRLGLETPFLGAVHEAVIESMGSGFPELAQHRDDVRRLLEAEEERFAQTLATGSRLLDDLIARAREEGASSLHAGDVFELHDTHGFPVELTAELAREAGLGIDLEGFERKMQQQRERARAAARRGDGVEAERIARFARSAPPSEFVGYSELDVETRGARRRAPCRGPRARQAGALAVLPRGRRPGLGQRRDPGARRARPDRVRLPPGRRPGAARAAGRRAARGRRRARPRRRSTTPARRWPTTRARTCCSARCATTSASTSSRPARPCARTGCASTSRIRRPSRRTSCGRSRTRSTGSCSRIASCGSSRPRRTRRASSARRCCSARSTATSCASSTSRAIRWSCAAAPMCARPPPSGRSAIVRESSVGQGVRRIEAITGPEALGALRRADRAAKEAAAALRTPPEQLPEAVVGAQRARARAREGRPRGRRRANGGGPDLSALTASAAERGRLKVLVAEAPAGTLGDSLLELADRLRGALGPSAVVLGVRDGERVQLVASMTPEAVEDGLDAAAVIKQIGPIVGGGGGGRPAMARAGGKDASSPRRGARRRPRMLSA